MMVAPQVVEHLRHDDEALVAATILCGVAAVFKLN
jgi:hypothetical protein